ncbi:unnamed protein product [Ophioblennius macclurei]
MSSGRVPAAFRSDFYRLLAAELELLLSLGTAVQR